MRAHEIPGLLFESIHQATEEPPILQFDGCLPWRYFPIGRDDDGFPFADIGHFLDRTKYGLIGRLAVWDGYVPRDCELPILLTIFGGPIPNEIWTRDRGQQLCERIIIKPEVNWYGDGLAADQPTSQVIIEVLSLASSLIRDRSPANLIYWEAFRRPEAKFTRRS